MPRIIAPQDPGAPAQVINLPRPREVSGTPTGLGELGTAIGNAGQMFLAEAVRQERSAEATRISTEADTRWGQLRSEVEQAGTATEARQLWMAGAPKVKEEVARFAQERGLPEALPGLDALAKANDVEVHNFIGRRTASEGVDAAKVYAATKLENIVNAPTELEAQRHKIDLHRELERVAQTNPLLSPGDADRLFQTVVSDGARRRLNALVDKAVTAGDIGGLGNLQERLAEGGFPDLPEDLRAGAANSIAKSIEQVQAQHEADARKAGARAASDLFIGIFDATNPAQLEEIRQETDRLFYAGAIGADTRVSLHRNAVSKRNGLMEGINELADIAGRYRAGFGLNDQKEVTKLFEAMAQDVPPEQHAALMAEVTINAGIPPKQGTDLLKRAETMDQPEQLAVAASYLGAIQDRAPAAASRMTVGPRVESTLAYAEVLGITEGDAAALIIDQAPDQQVIQRRSDQFDKTFEDWEPLTFLQEHGIAPEFWFTADTEVSERLLIETEETMQRVWQMTGNREAAEQAAASALQRRFSVTQVGGAFRLTETPPEPFGQMAFRGNVEADVISEAIDVDIERRLKAEGIEIPEAPAGLEHIPPWETRTDDQTRAERSTGEPPSWQLWVRDELGNMRRLPDGRGGFMRYPMPIYERLKMLPPVQEAIGESTQAANRERIGAARTKVTNLTIELTERQRVGALPHVIADVERRLEEARQELADAEARAGP